MKNICRLLCSLTFITLIGCSAVNKETKVYKVPKKIWDNKEASAPQTEMPRNHPPVGNHPTINKSSYVWNAPKSWKEKAGSSIRIGSFSVVENSSTTDISVIVLSAQGGPEYGGRSYQPLKEVISTLPGYYSCLFCQH